MARTNSCCTPACFTDAIDFPLEDEEKELIRIAHRWLSEYCWHIKEPHARIPQPIGTVHEAWSTLTMVCILSGYADLFPALRVKDAVPTPPDFIPRIGALVRRLEAREDSVPHDQALF